jgi:hypothetical protein
MTPYNKRSGTYLITIVQKWRITEYLHDPRKIFHVNMYSRSH